MKRNYFFLSCLLLASLDWSETGIMAQCASQANIYTGKYNGRTYEVVKEKKNWTDAARCAVERGGHLVEINDAAEQGAVFSMIADSARISWNYSIVATGGGISYIWIGATDQKTEGTWLWDGNNDGTGTHFWTGQGKAGNGNGSPVNSAYHNWGGSSNGMNAQEPDNFGGSQHCAAIGLSGWPVGTTLLGSTGQWNDISGSNELYYVIEYAQTSNIRQPAKQATSLLYPNPAEGLTSITSDIPMHNLTLYDLGGRIIQTLHPNSAFRTDISLRNLPAGIYHLQVDCGSSTTNHRLIVQAP